MAYRLGAATQKLIAELLSLTLVGHNFANIWFQVKIDSRFGSAVKFYVGIKC